MVLTGVRSVTHVLYANSYLRRRLDQGAGAIHLTVVPTEGLLEGLSEPAVRALFPIDPRLTVELATDADPWWQGTARDLVLLSIGAPGTRAYRRLLQARAGRRPLVVVADEGIGSYGSWVTRRDAYVRQGGEPRVSAARAVVVSAANAVLPDVRWTLYRRDRTSWFFNAEIAAEFRRRVEGDAPPPRTAVYLTQPWVDLGLVSEQQYAAHLREVSAACDRAGLRLVVRPHPRERLRPYADLPTIPTDRPAEIDRAVVDAAVVLGANSTALLNVRAIHRSPVARVRLPELAGLDARLGARQRSLLDAFLPTPVTVDRLTERLTVD